MMEAGRASSDQRAISRRALCVGAGGAAVLLGMGSLKAFASESLCRPPGGQDEDRLMAACLRCERCREVCPNGVIAPAKIEDGILNVRTPTMDFKLGWCDFCSAANDARPLCAQVCPTAALSLPDGAKAESVIIGRAVINHDWCLGWLLKGCQRCYEVCPYEAIEIEYLEGFGSYNISDYKRPHVIADRCNGCGICELECPSMQNSSLVQGATDRAITIEPLAALESDLAAQRGGAS
jgi:ferredoxin-type protein NapG